MTLSSYFQNSISNWKKRSIRQQNQYLLYFFIICASVAIVIVTVCKRESAKVQQEILEIQLATSPAGLSGEIPAGTNLPELNKSLKALRESMIQLNRQEINLRGRLAPRRDLEAHQNLKIAITTLANSCDLLLDQFVDVGLAKEEAAAPPSEVRWDRLAKNKYERPLVHFQARASYAGLMQFLEGLQALPYMVSPVRFDIQVKIQKDDAGVLRQWLSISMDLTL